jgi:hypothetical protein
MLPEGDTVFSLVYEGAIYIAYFIRPIGGKRPRSRNGNPIEEGLELFGEALGVWLECFEGPG